MGEMKKTLPRAKRYPHLPTGVILSGAEAAKWAERSRRIPLLYERQSLEELRDSSTAFQPAFAHLELRSE